MNTTLLPLRFRLFLLLLLSFSSFTSCVTSTSNSSPQTSNDFTINGIKQAFVPNEINGNPEYHFTGSVSNNTNSIFSKATVFMSVIFVLDNGKEITDMDNHEDGNRFSWAGAQALESLRMFEPQQTVNMDEMISADVPKAYEKYPVRSVHLRFKVEYTDEVNNVENEVYLADQDITNDWRSFFNSSSTSSTIKANSKDTAAVAQDINTSTSKQDIIDIAPAPADIISPAILADNSTDQVPLQTGVIVTTHNYEGDRTLTICFKDKSGNYQAGNGYVLDEAGLANMPDGKVDSTIYVPGRRVAFKAEFMGTSAGSDQLIYLKALPAPSVHMPAQVKIIKRIIYNQ